MTTIEAQLIGDKALLPRVDLERLLELARQTQEVDLKLHEDDVPTPDVMRLAEQSGAFDFLHDPGEDIYSIKDGEPV